MELPFTRKKKSAYHTNKPSRLISLLFLPGASELDVVDIIARKLLTHATKKIFLCHLLFFFELVEKLIRWKFSHGSSDRGS